LTSSTHRTHQRKRRYSDHSLDNSNSSASIGRQSRNMSPEVERNTRRKRREYSPTERGRRRDSSVRGSRRDKSQNHSQERSRVARERRSMTPNRQRLRSPHPNDKEVYGSAARARERSLSPFSKRLALTQAMNRGR